MRQIPMNIETAATLARAYLDRDKQVRELAFLVKLAFTEGRRTGMDYYEIGGSKYGFSFYESPISDGLARILGAEDGE
jgi:hypothetical protein